MHAVTITRTAAAGLLAAALLLAGCGSDSDGAADESTTTVADTTATTEAAEEVEVTDAWARQSPMATTAGAVYLNITSPTDDALLSAAVPAEIAASVEVHETVMAEEGDTMTMQPVDAIDLPAGETVALEPGGYHIMLLELVEPLEVGASFDVTLTLENAGEVTVTADVREG